jgi:hypothetical protein
MHMHMQGMGGEHAGMPHPRRRRRPPALLIVILVFNWVFYLMATVCFLGAVNRAAGALKLEARIKALKTMPDAFTEEEQMLLIRKVTTRALGGI